MVEEQVDYQKYVRPLIFYPHKQLHEKCVPVPPNLFGTSKLEEQIKAMYATMKVNGGIGIAASQIQYEFKTKKPNQVIVIEFNKDKYVFINPIILDKQGEYTFNEGCLSLPGYFRDITRAKTIHVIYTDTDGKQHGAKMTDTFATIMQHEYDHLQGITMISGLSMIKRKMAERKISKQRKGKNERASKTKETIR